MSEDSEVKTQEETPLKPSGPVTIIVKTPFGGLRKAIKGPNGRFMAEPRIAATNKDGQEIIREFLDTKLEKGPDGKVTKRSKTRRLEQLEAMHTLITNGNPDTANAAQAAWKTMVERADGRVPLSDKELGALERGGIQAIYINMPDSLPMIIEKPKELKPSFIDAEIIEGPKE